MRDVEFERNKTSDNLKCRRAKFERNKLVTDNVTEGRQRLKQIQTEMSSKQRVEKSVFGTSMLWRKKLSRKDNRKEQQKSNETEQTPDTEWINSDTEKVKFLD